MQFEDGWKDGVLATIGTMALQLQQAHQVVENLSGQLNDLKEQVADLEEIVATVSEEAEQA